MKIKLTPEQEIAVNKVKDFLDSHEEIFTLAGVSGAGKTSCIKEALRGRDRVIGATISHSAKDVLQTSLETINCTTIAQLLKLTRKNTSDGEIQYTFDVEKNAHKMIPIRNYDVLIIDECSMIDQGIFNWIMELKQPKAKVIFLGDPYQLKPIEGEANRDSITFDYKQAELLTPIRYTGPLADLGNRIKSEIDKVNNDEAATKYLINEWNTELGYEERTSKVNSEGSGYIYLNDLAHMIKLAGKIFKESTHPDDLRILAYRNHIIKKLNQVVREEIYGEDKYKIIDDEGDEVMQLPQFMPNELVICNGGYSTLFPDSPIPYPVINNNAIFRVLDTTPMNGPNNIHCLAMKLDPMPNLPPGGEILAVEHEYGRMPFFNHLNELKHYAKETRNWNKYFAFKEQFAWFEYNYAQNAHKAQGRTYKDVIIVENDILDVKKNTIKEKLQALYVNCTRAKRRVFIYNKKYRIDQSLLPDKLKEELDL